MNKRLIRVSISILMLLVHSLSYAQQVTKPIVEECTMRSNGKIFVVLAICLTILFGLILYVASIDKKISKIENEND